MSELTGTFWKSATTLDDPNFQDTIILIVAHEVNGAVGLILNQPYHRRFNELTEFISFPPLRIHVGGPVDQEHLFFLHKNPSLIEDGIRVTNEWYYGGNFNHVLAGLKSGSLSAKDVKIYLGYAGWDKDQFEAEIEEGSWMRYPEAVSGF